VRCHPSSNCSSNHESNTIVTLLVTRTFVPRPQLQGSNYLLCAETHTVAATKLQTRLVHLEGSCLGEAQLRCFLLMARWYYHDQGQVVPIVMTAALGLCRPLSKILLLLLRKERVYGIRLWPKQGRGQPTWFHYLVMSLPPQSMHFEWRCSSAAVSCSRMTSPQHCLHRV
jgi:hypothetical protein